MNNETKWKPVALGGDTTKLMVHQDEEVSINITAITGWMDNQRNI